MWMQPTCAACSASCSRAPTPASRPTTPASSSAPRRSRATRASSPRASSSRCCTGCDAGDRPVGHLETDYLFRGATPADALAPLLALTLQDVKRHLDACIQRQEPRTENEGRV